MTARLCAALELLLDIRYQISLCLACNLCALVTLWLFYSQLDSPSHPDETGTSIKAENLEQEQKEDSVKGETAPGGGSRIPIVQDVSNQARSRDIQSKAPPILPLENRSNRSLQDSIWATPNILPPEDKTPTRKTHPQTKFKDPLVPLVPSPDCDDLCSNRAGRRTKEPTLQEKLKAFERKSIGIPPLFDGAFQPTNNGPARLRRYRSFPRLRHSVMAWWAGVEQEDVSAEPPRESDAASEFEEHSDCSVCEVIRPGDSWSAVVHNQLTANDEDRTPTRTPKIFTSLTPVTLAPSRRIH